MTIAAEINRAIGVPTEERNKSAARSHRSDVAGGRAAETTSIFMAALAEAAAATIGVDAASTIGDAGDNPVRSVGSFRGGIDGAVDPGDFAQKNRFRRRGQRRERLAKVRIGSGTRTVRTQECQVTA